MAAILNLSYHKASNDINKNGLLGDDALFLKAAIETGLIKEDLLHTYPPTELMASKRLNGILQGTYKGYKTYSLLKLDYSIWNQKRFSKQKGVDSEFEKWLKKITSKPIDCLVLAGHHGVNANNHPMIWGLENSEDIPSAALIPQKDNKSLTVFGVGRTGHAQLRAGPIDMSTALSSTRMIVILGCNGTVKEAATYWQEWVSEIRGVKPIVLGFYNKHSMVRDWQIPNKSLGEVFWSKLKTLQANKGANDFHELCDKYGDSVIGAWGESLDLVYPDGHERRHLWYHAKRKRGAGAMDMNSNEWRVTSTKGPISKWQ
ncbi:hypothetical protein [Photobacterium ganghwense]|uniref:hypothetical protein n=1 Tax=Photobacterium ganghwense TaxID=320778 RepID=UPI001C2D37A5|nr:hypothetical protein [Photobacterium ganghwense]MBV1839079.1 hypothetical protein [Photobacterium ganghwense]